MKRRTIQVSPWGAAALTLERRQVGFGEPFDMLRAVSGSAELTVEALVEPLSRAVHKF